jgi:hypothetical protein
MRTHIVGPWIAKWFAAVDLSGEGQDFSGLSKILWIAWEFGNQALFTSTCQRICLHARLATPVPAGILVPTPNSLDRDGLGGTPGRTRSNSQPPEAASQITLAVPSPKDGKEIIIDSESCPPGVLGVFLPLLLDPCGRLTFSLQTSLFRSVRTSCRTCSTCCILTTRGCVLPARDMPDVELEPANDTNGRLRGIITLNLAKMCDFGFQDCCRLQLGSLVCALHSESLHLRLDACPGDCEFSPSELRSKISGISISQYQPCEERRRRIWRDDPNDRCGQIKGLARQIDQIFATDGSFINDLQKQYLLGQRRILGTYRLEDEIALCVSLCLSSYMSPGHCQQQ